MLSFVVYGRPAPQGSKKLIGHGQMVEVSKYLKPWRQAVERAAEAAIARVPQWQPMTGALLLRVSFSLQPPAKPVRGMPYVRPDLSKLVRGVEDALTNAGVWQDDALVCGMVATKVYVGKQLNRPGAVISVDYLECETFK